MVAFLAGETAPVTCQIWPRHRRGKERKARARGRKGKKGKGMWPTDAWDPRAVREKSEARAAVKAKGVRVADAERAL